eukprot:1447022-Amphidinium_carterae.1
MLQYSDQRAQHQVDELQEAPYHGLCFLHAFMCNHNQSCSTLRVMRLKVSKPVRATTMSSACKTCEQSNQ